MCAGPALLLWGAHHGPERGNHPAAAWPPPRPGSSRVTREGPRHQAARSPGPPSSSRMTHCRAGLTGRGGRRVWLSPEDAFS